MTDPTPAPASDPLAGRPKPMLTPGRAPADYTGPTFDPADVVAQIPPRPQTGTFHTHGDFREPTEPDVPPPGVEVPEDLAAALREYADKRSAWEAAVDAVEDFRDGARLSRVKREEAVRAAGRAAASGTKRPTIPSATSEADEEIEVRVLSAVVEARLREANDAARTADRISMSYAAAWADRVIARFGSALDEATAATQAAYEASARAQSVLNQAAYWRATAIGQELERSGVAVNSHHLARIASDLLDAAKTRLYASAEAQHRHPIALLGQVHEALGTLRGCDPAAVAHPDALRMPGPAATGRQVWWRIWDTAPEATQRRYRDRHPTGFPPR